MAKTKMKKGYITLEDGRTMRVQRMSTLQYMFQHKWLYFLLLPGVLYFILFRYIPMGGLVIRSLDDVQKIPITDERRDKECWNF